MRRNKIEVGRIYIRPWPPAWSFLRRICTSRGSERVKALRPKMTKIASGWSVLVSLPSVDIGAKTTPKAIGYITVLVAK